MSGVVAPDPLGDPQLGLSSEQVRQRTDAGLTNRVTEVSSRSVWDIIRANVLTLFNGIVGGCFVLLLVLGQWRDALFGLSVVGNAVIGVVQEYRAKLTLDRLAVIETPLARVVRGGEVQEIPVDDVVQDDVLVLRAGDQVAADATVLESTGLEIDESLLTGESDPVVKEHSDTVFSGSIIVAGAGRARATHVGAQSFAHRLTTEAKRFSLVDSEIRNGINRVLRWVSWALLPITLIVINGQMQASGGWEQAIQDGRWREAAVGTVAGVIAMIPLGLVLLTSIAFAVGGVRLAQQNVLIQELATVEVLARVDVLCLDKTGTLTEGTVVFDAVHPLPASAATEATASWRQILGWFAADPNANATARSLLQQFPAESTVTADAAIPFSSERKWSAVAFASGEARGSWVLGAPELVLNQNQQSDSLNATTLSLANELAAAGRRTLVLAYSSVLISRETTSAPPADENVDALPAGLTPLLLLTFRETTRPDAAQTLSYFHDQRVEMRIISGDDPRTVAAVAREVGIQVDEGYNARSLPSDPDELAEVMENHRVFGRVTPAQKKGMVEALQRRGHVVAMIGDGVNDVLALKQADIGIAMNTAAAATKAVSRLVLLDGRFDRLPSVVAEGRRVIANIERVSVVFLTKTTYAMALSVTFGLLIWIFPFLPRQLSLTDAMTIGIPCFFLALMHNNRSYRPGFLRRSLSFAVPAGLIISAAVLSVHVYVRQVGGFDTAQVQGASVIVLSLVALWVLGVKSRPLSFARIGILVGAYAVLIAAFAIPFVRDFFHLSVPPAGLLQVSLIVSLVGCLAIEILGQVRVRADAREDAGPPRRASGT